MAERTGIAWTDHTFNPWIGCQKVSPGCDHCYAETLNQRYGWTEWGPQGKRRRTSPANWKNPLAWHRAALRLGVKRRVFCASLADVFDNQAPEGAREDLWQLIRDTPGLDWQLLTKRPQNMLQMLPQDWNPEKYSNVWLGITAENQAEYDRRWPLLAQTPATVRFISYEPALGPLNLACHEAKPDWLIWGGESGPNSRVMNARWVRDITQECKKLDIPVFGKQWGSYASNPLVQEQGMDSKGARKIDPEQNGKGGALLDGELHRNFPRGV